MGIMNLTPDSFSDGGELPGVDDALRRAEALLDEGADVLLENEHGLNALDFALIGSQPDSAVVLKAAILARQRLKRGTW